MSKWRRIVGAVLLTGLLMVNGTQLLGDSPTADGKYIEAGIPWPKPYLKKKQYSPDGKFLGCWDDGANCIVIPLVKGELTLSSAGVHMQ